MPSLILFVIGGWAALRMYMLTPASRPAAPARTPDGLLNLVETAGHMVGSVFQFVGAAGQWLAILLTVVGFIVLLFAAVLLVTARGLRARRMWARIVASLIMLWVLFSSSVAWLSAGRSLATLYSVLLSAVSIYALWVLWRRFA